MAWVQEPDGKTRCALHDRVFAAGLETCPDCTSTPNSIVIEHAAAPPVETEAIGDETWCRDARDRLTELAKAQANKRGKGAAAGIGYAIKLYEAALKFHRTAMEERTRRKDRDHDRWLVAQHRELQLRGKPH